MPWKPLFQEASEREKIYTRLSDIANALNSISSSPSLKLGLAEGVEGIILFYFYYYKLTKDKFLLDRGIRLLQEIFESPDYYNIYPLSNGFAGLAWLFEHVCHLDFFEADAEVLKEIDMELGRHMIMMVEEGQWSFLKGAIGIGSYFLSKKDLSESKPVLENLIAGLSRVGIEEKDQSVKWCHFDGNKTIQGRFNLGMSQGMAGMISFLVRAYSAGISSESTLRLLKGSVKYVLKNRNSRGTDASFFPYAVYDDNTKNTGYSRLAWCHGDLGISCAMLQAATLLKDDALMNQVFETLVVCSKRRDLRENMVFDAGLCHGTSGIAHLFIRMYNYWNNEIFRETSAYWIDATLKMNHFEDGICGYKVFSPATNDYIDSYGLFEGISGIGLALIASVSDFPPSWDDSLLL